MRADVFVLGAERANVRLEGSFGSPIGLPLVNRGNLDLPTQRMPQRDGRVFEPHGEM